MGSTLESVRITRGFTQSRLEAASGVSQAAISLIETGHQVMSDSVRDTLAAALDVSPLLLGTLAPSVLIRHAPQHSVPARAIKRVSAELTLAYVHVGLLAGNIRYDIAPRALGEDLAPDRAIELRRKWNVGPGSVDDIVGLLEEHGIICLHRDLSGLRVNAIAATSEDGRALMLLDPRADADASRWAIAHELGHLVMHDTSDRLNEASADEFAGEFLAPRTELRARREAGDDIDDLVRLYRIPPADFARHAQRGRLVTVAEYRRLRRAPSTHRTQLPGPALLAETLRSRVFEDSIEDIAASALLTEESLQRDYLDGSRLRPA